MKNLDLSSQRHEYNRRRAVATLCLAATQALPESATPRRETEMQNSECLTNSVPLCLCAFAPSSRSAFTLLEVMIATALFGLVVAGTIEVYIMCNKLWHATSLSMQATRESSLALSHMVYGMETNNGLRSAGTITLANFAGGSWRMTASNGVETVKYYYNSSSHVLSNANSIICNNVSTSSITTNANGTLRIQLTVEKHDGLFHASNTVSTLVNMRNKP